MTVTTATVKTMAGQVVRCMTLYAAQRTTPPALDPLLPRFATQAMRQDGGDAGAILARILAARGGTLPNRWAHFLDRAPTRCALLAADIVAAAQALTDTTVPPESWQAIALQLGPLLAQRAEEVAVRPPPRKPLTTPTNLTISAEQLARVLDEVKGNRNGAARRIGLSHQTIDGRIEAARDKPDHPLFRHVKPKRHYFSNAELASFLEQAGGDPKEAARLAGIGRSKLMDRIWTAGEKDPDLGKYWRPKYPTGRPPVVTEEQIAPAVQATETFAAAAERLSVTKSTVSRRTRTATSDELRGLNRPAGTPHPHQRVTTKELVAALEKARWNYREAARLLEGRISDSGIGRRVEKALRDPDSSITRSHHRWQAHLAGR